MFNSENDERDISCWLFMEHSDETTSLQPFTTTKKRYGQPNFFIFKMKEQLIKEKVQWISFTDILVKLCQVMAQLVLIEYLTYDFCRLNLLKTVPYVIMVMQR